MVIGQRHENPGKAPMSGSLAREIEILLQEAFLPTRLDVINDSARHRGHMGDDGSGESHFTVVIESVAFAGKGRLERQRMVNRALGDIPGQRVHALAIRAFAPGDSMADEP
jgi:BolA protein